MKKIKISKLVIGDNNPRIITQANLERLKKSIKEFESMMVARPIIVNDGRVIGGNQRLRALTELGYKDVPEDWVKFVSFTEEQERQFIVKDNASFGSWDWEELFEEFEADELEGWGVDLPDLGDLDKVSEVNDLQNDEWVGMPEFESKEEPMQIVVKFDSENERKEFAERMNIKFTYAKEGNKTWTTWYPYKGAGDWKSKKYE